MSDVPIAVASRSFSRHPVLRRELAAAYSSVRFNDAGESLAGPRLVEFLRGAERAIIALERIDGQILGQLPTLKVISKYGVGVDELDLDAMTRLGVALGWTPGVNRRSVAELVVAFAILLLHRVPEASALVRAGQWRQVIGRQLSDATVGIIGCGHVGKEVAVLMRAHGARVLAHDLLDFPDFYVRHGVQASTLDELLGGSDVVTIHVPRNRDTELMLNRGRLALMKPGAVLVNAARGGLVDEAALRDRLVEGHLSGAAFDVFACEPPTEHDLLSLPNFLATPHIGGSCEEAILNMGRAAIAGLSSARLPSVDWPLPPATARV